MKRSFHYEEDEEADCSLPGRSDSFWYWIVSSHEGGTHLKQQIYNTGIYLRLSCDDDVHGESVSISNQRQMLTQYCREHGLRLVDEYVDDGYSGTNFDRPSFQRMQCFVCL